MTAARIDLADGIVGWLYGEGETVVWLHGYTMDSSLWTECWRKLPRFRHIGIDLPGHGASRGFRPEDSLAAVAAAVVRACRDMNAEALVGMSLGSLVALQAAMVPANGLRRLVLAAPTTGGMTVEPSAQQKNIDLLRTYRRAGRGPELTRLWLSSPPDIFKSAERQPTVFEAIRNVVARHRWLELEGATMRDWSNTLQPNRALAEIAAHTLVLVGEEDMPGFRRNAHHLSRIMPRCDRHYVAGVGHLPLLEAPEICAPLLDAHLGS
jgi:pimeloyl-ACP methyl ester carboxylesterase